MTTSVCQDNLPHSKKNLFKTYFTDARDRLTIFLLLRAIRSQQLILRKICSYINQIFKLSDLLQFLISFYTNKKVSKICIFFVESGENCLTSLSSSSYLKNQKMLIFKSNFIPIPTILMFIGTQFFEMCASNLYS